jgi:hypothetical protein
VAITKEITSLGRFDEKDSAMCTFGGAKIGVDFGAVIADSVPA